MNDLIQRIYYDLLRKYPFSITGYPDASERLSQFFSEFTNHPIIKNRDNITFIIGLYAELESLDLKELNLHHVINWQTKPLSELYLINYDGEYPDLVLSYYLTLLSEFSNDKNVTATNIIADNVRGAVDIRIKLTSYTHASIHFIERENVIEFRTPLDIFESSLWDSDNNCLKTAAVRRILQKYIPPETPLQSSLIATASRRKPLVYTIDRSKPNVFLERGPSGPVHESSVLQIFCGDRLEEAKKDYAKELSHLGNGVLAGRFKSDLSEVEKKNIVSMALAGSFMAAYYDVNLDYILSVCNVSNDTFFTLGGLAVGSKRRQPLTTSDRAVLSIISDSISTRLSAQMIHDMFNRQFLKGQATNKVKALAKSGTSFHKLIEKPSPVGEAKNVARLAQQEFLNKRVSHVISDGTTKLIKEYLNDVENDKPDIRAKYQEVSNLISFSSSDLWKFVSAQIKTLKDQLLVEATLKPSRASDLSMTKLFADYRWICRVIETAFENLNNSKAFPSEGMNGRSAKVDVEIFFIDASGQQTNKPLNGNPRDHVLCCNISDNGVGFDVFCLPHRGGGWSVFLDDSETLNAHGELTIESRGKTLDFLKPVSLQVDETLPISDSKVHKDGTVVSLTIKLS
jgi:hypothetical protein